MKRLCQGLALAAFLAAPLVSSAQEAADERKTESQEPVVEAEVADEEPSGPNAGKLSFSGGTGSGEWTYLCSLLREILDSSAVGNGPGKH